VEDLPLTKSVCSILPTARYLRAGVQLPGPRFLKATVLWPSFARTSAMWSNRSAPAALAPHLGDLLALYAPPQPRYHVALGPYAGPAILTGEVVYVLVVDPVTAL
jgi:hypothetical protein